MVSHASAVSRRGNVWLINVGPGQVTDPDNGKVVYIHPPGLMPMAFDGWDARPEFDTWIPFAESGKSSNNHLDLGGINVLFLDGHTAWGDQESDPQRVNVQGTNGKMRW